MSRKEKFCMDFVGVFLFCIVAGPIFTAVIAFVRWQAPADWLEAAGYTWAGIRLYLGAAFVGALWRQLTFKRGES